MAMKLPLRSAPALLRAPTCSVQSSAVSTIEEFFASKGVPSFARPIRRGFAFVDLGPASSFPAAPRRPSVSARALILDGIPRRDAGRNCTRSIGTRQQVPLRLNHAYGRVFACFSPALRAGSDGPAHVKKSRCGFSDSLGCPARKSDDGAKQQLACCFFRRLPQAVAESSRTFVFNAVAR